MKTHKFPPEQQRSDTGENSTGRPANGVSSSADSSSAIGDTTSLTFSTCSNFCLSIGSTTNSTWTPCESPTSVNQKADVSVLSICDSDGTPKETKLADTSGQSQSSIYIKIDSSAESTDNPSSEASTKLPLSPAKVCSPSLPGDQQVCLRAGNLHSPFSNETNSSNAESLSKPKSTGEKLFHGQRPKLSSRLHLSSSQRKLSRKNKVKWDSAAYAVECIHLKRVMGFFFIRLCISLCT